MLLNRLFLYMEGNYISGSHRMMLGKQAQHDFKTRIMEGLEDGIRATLIQQINADREDEQIDRDAVKTAINIYVDLGREGDKTKPVRKNNMFYWEGNDNLEYYE